jgi:excisionase family DNA binding protein
MPKRERMTVMVEAPVCVTLKRAAEALGVHEQTLRNWEKRGVIRMVRLPGSGYRRVPVDKIERLQDEMARSQQGVGVQIVPPPEDDETWAEACELAKAVCAELADLETEATLDECLESRRGRTWLS